MKRFLKAYSREFSLLGAIVVMTVFFGILNPIYLSVDNIKDILEQATIYGLMGVGMTAIIISGGIDLSVGSSLALISVIVAKAAVNGVNFFLCILLGIVSGMVLGLFNGFLVSKMKLQPFIATLGSMSIYRGIVYLITGAVPITRIPREFRNLVDGEIFPLMRISLIVFFLYAIVMHIVMKKTRLGSYTFAIGGGEEVARLSGIRVDVYKILIYGVGMLGTALAAMVLLGKLGTGDPTAGQGYEMHAIAAAVIGGTSMAGGRGSVPGTIAGAVLFSGLKVGLIVIGVNTFWQYIATGIVIIIAAYIEIAQSQFGKSKGNVK
jgi:ribose transport system permease protein